MAQAGEDSYRGDVRLNLTLPDDLYADLERIAKREGIQPTSYARVLIARGLGRAEALDELAALKERVAALESKQPADPQGTDGP